MFGQQQQLQKPVGFGAPASAPQTTTFGQPPPNTPVGFVGGFGQPAAIPAFGQQPNQSMTGFGGGSTGMFGNKPPALNMASFGGNQTSNTQTNQQPTQGFGGFGAATTAQPLTAFGGQATGTAGQQQPTGFGFGAQPQSTSLFGASAGFGQPQPSSFGNFGTFPLVYKTGQQQQQQQQQPQQPQAIDHVKHLYGCWDPKNPACLFKFYFYNMVHPSEVSLYQPAQEEDRVLYDQAQMDNPDSSCMVPVIAVGFEGLKTRLEIQDEQLKIHKEKLQVSLPLPLSLL
jgi:nuclear pore complex protein Nup54